MKPSNARDDIPSVFIVRLTIVYILYVFPTQNNALSIGCSQRKPVCVSMSSGGVSFDGFYVEPIATGDRQTLLYPSTSTKLDTYMYPIQISTGFSPNASNFFQFAN